MGNGGTVQSFNWDGTNQCATGCFLHNQDYSVCFRQEKGEKYKTIPKRLLIQIFCIRIFLNIQHIDLCFELIIGMCGIQFSETIVAAGDAFELKDMAPTALVSIVSSNSNHN